MPQTVLGRNSKISSLIASRHEGIIAAAHKKSGENAAKKKNIHKPRKKAKGKK